MKTENLRIKITPDGKVEIKVEGVKGDGCMKIVKPFEDALGGEVVDRQYTEEYYEKEDVSVSEDEPLKQTHGQ